MAGQPKITVQRRCEMRCRIMTVAFLAAVVLCVGCDRPAQIKYLPGDKNVTTGGTEEWNFDRDAVGKPPEGAEVFGGTWVVQAETDAPSKPNALCQTATAEFQALAL